MHPQQTDRMSGRCSRKSTGRDGRRQEKKHTVGFVEMTEKKGKLPPRKVRQFPRVCVRAAPQTCHAPKAAQKRGKDERKEKNRPTAVYGHGIHPYIAGTDPGKGKEAGPQQKESRDHGGEEGHDKSKTGEESSKGKLEDQQKIRGKDCKEDEKR